MEKVWSRLIHMRTIRVIRVLVYSVFTQPTVYSTCAELMVYSISAQLTVYSACGGFSFLCTQFVVGSAYCVLSLWWVQLPVYSSWNVLSLRSTSPRGQDLPLPPLLSTGQSCNTWNCTSQGQLMISILHKFVRARSYSILQAVRHCNQSQLYTGC